MDTREQTLELVGQSVMLSAQIARLKAQLRCSEDGRERADCKHQIAELTAERLGVRRKLKALGKA